jgi:hypothetical protein
MKTLKQVNKKKARKLLKKGNVVSVGVGLKNDTGEECLVVGVTKKVPVEELDKKDMVPTKVKKYKTDVVEQGEIKALATTDKHRPSPPGVSIGHHKITSGTFGCVVENEYGEKLLLSNNHVFADTNDGEIGDAILQPGPGDGGNNNDDVIGTLDDYYPLSFEGVPARRGVTSKLTDLFNWLANLFRRNTLLQTVENPYENIIDAALALPLDYDMITSDILELGIPKGVGEAELGDAVRKSGRTTGYTRGYVTQMDATIQVNMGEGRIAIFEDQVVSNMESAGGDSGSAILNSSDEVVGLLFAGGNGVTVFNKIQNVLDYFEVQIATV